MLNIVGFRATAGECPSTVASVSLMHRPQGDDWLCTNDFVRGLIGCALTFWGLFAMHAH